MKPVRQKSSNNLPRALYAIRDMPFLPIKIRNADDSKIHELSIYDLSLLNFLAIASSIVPIIYKLLSGQSLNSSRKIRVQPSNVSERSTNLPLVPGRE